MPHLLTEALVQVLCDGAEHLVLWFSQEVCNYSMPHLFTEALVLLRRCRAQEARV
jgi:hypothetical protein